MKIRELFNSFFKKQKESGVEMKVEKIIVDPELKRFLVVLSYANGERSSVFPMSLEENNSAIVAGIQVIKDLFLPLSRKFNLELENVRLYRKEGGTEAEVRWKLKNRRQKISLSVTEALVLSIAAEVPLIMSEELLNSRSSSFPMLSREKDKKNPFYIRYGNNVDFDSEVVM